MAKRLNKTDRAKYDRLMRMYEKDPLEYLGKLEDFAHEMDKKYGEPMAEIKGFSKGGMGMKKKGYAMGGMKKKGYAKGGMKKKGYAKGGFPDLTGDGKVTKKDILKGRGVNVNKGGMMKKKKGYAKGGAMKKKAYAKGGKVAMYNVGGMVKSSNALNTGIARAKNTYK
mgnify:CR=1 FL=1|tara:strand:+ start:56 stop:559 length:504 start_codon:yes stop_codon:yes gene_type:complete